MYLDVRHLYMFKSHEPRILYMSMLQSKECNFTQKSILSEFMHDIYDFKH